MPAAEQKFNHDILLTEQDQKLARERWPNLAHVLINKSLIDEFNAHEEKAKLR